MLSECEMDDLYHAVRRLRAATSLVACLLAVEPFVDNSGRASAPFEGLAEVVARIAVRTGASTGLFEGQDELLDMGLSRMMRDVDRSEKVDAKTAMKVLAS